MERAVYTQVVYDVLNKVWASTSPRRSDDFHTIDIPAAPKPDPARFDPLSLAVLFDFSPFTNESLPRGGLNQMVRIVCQNRATCLDNLMAREYLL